MPKKITIENLAGMIKRGFDETARDLNSFRSEVNKHFEQIDRRMDKFELKLAHTDARVAMIERDIAEIRKNIIYRHEFEDALARISFLEKKLGVKNVR